MDIEILSVNNKDDSYEVSQRHDEISQQLAKNGFTLTYINSVDLKGRKILDSLDKSAETPSKPEFIIIANALSQVGTKCFKKHFVEVVAAAERAEKVEVPKNYWRKRNKVFKKAKKQGISGEELEELKDKFRVYKKKSKIFNLGDFGNGYKGYCFMYKGIKVAVLPQAVLTGVDVRDVITLAAVRTKEVFENSAADYPGGFKKVEYVPPKKGFANNYIPLPGDGFREGTRKCVVIASFLVFCWALGLLMYNMVFLSVQNKQLNGEIQKIYHGTTDDGSSGGGDTKPDTGDSFDWNSLKKINDEIVGWIQINDTRIDYPVLWHEGDDRSSQYYLSHNYKGEWDPWGSIFIDYRCSKAEESKNVVIHGHHMDDGSMFADLLKYGGTSGNLDFYKSSPTITFNTPEENATYKIISVFKTNTLSSQGEFYNYMVGDFQNEKDFMNYVYNVRIRSLFNCPVDVNEDDELITLSTCSYEFTDFRTVVVARKVRDGESTKVDTSQASINNNAVWPEVYYNRYGGTRPEVTDFCTAYDAGKIDWYSGDYDFKEQKIVETETTVPATTNAQGNTAEPQTTVQPTTQAKVYVTIKFINYDGSLISEQKVEVGKAAKAPEDPVKPSNESYDYVFKGWQLDFSKVDRDMTIAPNFEAVPRATEEVTEGEVVSE